MIDDIFELMVFFPKSFVNSEKELILLPKENLFFQISDVENRNNLIYKLLAYGSYDFRDSKKLLDKANLFIKQSFSKDDMELIYKYLGNGINKELAYRFIHSGYDMNLLAKVEE